MTTEEIQEAVDLYKAGDSLSVLAKRFDVSTTTIYRKLTARHVQMRPRTGSHLKGTFRKPSWRTVVSEDEFRAMYRSGMSIEAIGRKIDRSTASVRRTVRVVGLTPRTKKEIAAMMSMEKNPNWVNGESLMDGYLYVKPGSTWAWPEMLNAHGYVLQHRKVMAESLGRALLPTENVHHINKDRRDNRVENLKLMLHEDHTRKHAFALWASGKYPDCVFGCGKRTKPYKGIHWKACKRCRVIAKNRDNPLCKEQYPRS